MRIAIVHNQPRRDADSATAELGVLDQVRLIASSLRRAGHRVRQVAAADVAALCADLSRDRPDLIFNCCESLDGHAALEMNVAALFELLQIPFTGSPPLALGLALNKALSKAVLNAAGILSPPHAVFEPGDTPHAGALRFPLIVKPVAEDGSIGIDAGAVVHDDRALARRVERIWMRHGQAALVEEFIEGREFNVALLAQAGGGFEVLPVGEIVFDALPPGRPAILDYDAKWNPDAPFRQSLASRCPAAIDDEWSLRMGRVAIAAARALGIRDYARVELRRRALDDALFVIEVNPNPDLNAGCEFLKCARTGGRTIAGTILDIVGRALERTAPQAAPAPLLEASE